MVARCGESGSSASHLYTVRPGVRLVPCGTPLATACHPSGTEMLNPKLAGSPGWLLTGNHVGALLGWPVTMAPSSVWINPAGPGRDRARGTPEYSTATVK